MKPMMVDGDYATASTDWPYDKIKEGDILIYQARWRSASDVMVAHMAAAKLGDEWIMKGINNVSYERSSEERMGRAEYRGKLLNIYTKRKKP